MKLENLNVVEMSSQEIVSVDGGDWTWVAANIVCGIVAVGTCGPEIVLGFAAGLGDGLKNGANEGRN